ncbi:MAG: fumarylacetoacetate hydrolase family protein [Gammaproteobacteria bacterium]|nr:fumarylacetoacetate hydrolase family protein [Gammaproteobacteria bacterium]MDH5172021.1 fumarylacetoacetate hydrolase family protein [Gammaproteobacteria bacterium]
MRFLTFSIADRSSWGAATDKGIIDLGARFGGSLLQVLQDNALSAMTDRAAGLEADMDLADIRYLPPISTPEKIACIGVNYANRNSEYRDDSEDPEWPSLFMRTIDSFTGHDQPLWRPPESHQLDYEGEIVMVIGKAGHRIPQARALEHVAGLTLMNEGTLRDWVRHAKFNVTQGKNFVHSGSIGPWLVSADEFAGYDALTLTTRVNGEQRQHDTTANLMFPFAYLVSYLSTFFILKPGDLISTGTPLGAGARFDPPRYLAPGDEVEVEVDGIGLLRNGVIDDPTV